MFIDVCGYSEIRLKRGLNVLFHRTQKQGDEVGSYMTLWQCIQKIAGYHPSLPYGLQLPALSQVVPVRTVNRKDTHIYTGPTV